MKWYKIAALVYRDFRIFRHMKYKVVEFFYFPITSIIIWGLFSLFVHDSALEAGLIVLVMNVFWSFAHTAQNTVNVSMMEDTWSGSLKHIFVSGISSIEYLAARMISSTIISVVMVCVLLLMSLYVFGVQIISTNFSLVITLVVLTLISSMALAAIVAGMILAAGREYGFLSWTAIEGFVLLSAPFYSVSVFPSFVQPIAWAMPFTNIFEGARQLITTGMFSNIFLINGMIVSLIYLVLSIPFYAYIFRYAKKNGNLVRMG